MHFGSSFLTKKSRILIFVKRTVGVPKFNKRIVMYCLKIEVNLVSVTDTQGQSWYGYRCSYSHTEDLKAGFIWFCSIFSPPFYLVKNLWILIGESRLLITNGKSCNSNATFSFQSPKRNVQRVPVNTAVVGITKQKRRDSMERVVLVSKKKKCWH